MNADQLRAGRTLLRWSQADLAERSDVSLSTIRRLEAMTGGLVGNATTLKALQTALDQGGVIFIAENGEGPGVRLRKDRPE